MFPSVFNPSLCLLSTIHFSLVLLFQAYVASRILPQQALSSGCSYHAAVGDCMVGRVFFFLWVWTYELYYTVTQPLK